MKNIGEGGEIALKIRLVRMRDEGLLLHGLEIIDVGFDDSYAPIDDVIYEEALICELNNNEDRLYDIGKKCGIYKGGLFDKADVYINGKGYSVKCMAGANPAMVNHTNRVGFERVCEKVGSDITVLDSIIDDYWDWRLNRGGTEDSHVSDSDSPFRDYKEYFRPILEYFFFYGSGSRDSEHPAEYVLDFDDPFDEDTWVIMDKDEVYDRLWDSLVFSLRSKKGMPKDYDLSYKGKGAESIAKWVRYCDGGYKGALHIRAKTFRRDETLIANALKEQKKAKSVKDTR